VPAFLRRGSPPDKFYLRIGDEFDIPGTRLCRSLVRLKSFYGPDLLLTSIEPPISAAEHGGVEELRQVVLRSQYRGDSMFPPKRWPVAVLIFRLEGPLNEEVEVGPDEVRLIGAGEVFATRIESDKGAIVPSE
jgi:hypothetical protein